MLIKRAHKRKKKEFIPYNGISFKTTYTQKPYNLSIY